MQRWEYCSLQLEQKVGYQAGVAQMYRGVEIEPAKEAVWEVHATLRLPGGDLRKMVFDPDHNFVDELNKLGTDGWELTGVVDEKSGLYDHPDTAAASTWVVKSFLFKRSVA